MNPGQAAFSLCLAALLVTAAFLLLRCGKVTPVQPSGDTSFPIKLSLEAEGRKSATFTGAPILTIIETPDQVPFTAINWFTGKAEFQASAATMQSTGSRFEAYLYWKTLPSLRDSTGAYDTIFVTTGGGFKRSNSIRVNVVNLPVIIDSVRLGTGTALATLPVKDTAWSYTAADNAAALTIQIYSRDLDGKTAPSLAISGDDGRIKQSGTGTLPFVLLYTLPAGRFSSTVIFMVYDHNGSQATRTIAFGRTDVPPAFDSVFANGTKFAGAANLFSYSQLAIDTVNITAYAHDPNAYDTLRLFFRAGQKNNIITDASGRRRSATYTCTRADCLQEFRDTQVVVDTVVIKAYDGVNDTVYKSVQILHGRPNQPPVVNGIKFGDTLLKGSDTLSTVKVTGGTSFRVVLLAADPNQDSLGYGFASVRPNSLSGINDSAATYAAADSLGTDTIRLSVADRRVSVVRRVAVVVNDLTPVFDSLTVDDTAFTGNDSVFRFRESIPRDTVKVTMYARDLDVQRDTLKYGWAGTGPNRIVSVNGNTALYRLADSTRNDTVVCTLIDGAYRDALRVVIPVKSHAPVIDSLRLTAYDSLHVKKADTLYAGADSVYPWAASLRDSLAMRCYGHDIDKGDILKCYWSAPDSSRLKTIAGAFTAVYRCGAAASTDNLTVSIEDPKKLHAVKYIQLKIGK